MGLFKDIAASVTDRESYYYSQQQELTDQVIQYNVRVSLYNAMTVLAVAGAAFALLRKSIVAVGSAALLLGLRVLIDQNPPFSRFDQGKFNPRIHVLGGVLWKHWMPAPQGFVLNTTGKGFVVRRMNSESFTQKTH